MRLAVEVVVFFIEVYLLGVVGQVVSGCGRMERSGMGFKRLWYDNCKGGV